MENRIIENIRKEMEKGENFFIMYGEYIHDLFMYNLYTGVCSMKETLRRYFLAERGYDYFVYIKNDSFETYRFLNGSFILCNEMFNGQATAGDDSDDLSLDDADDETLKANDNTAESTAQENSNSESENYFLKSVRYSQQNPDRKIIFFFEDYEWTTGLYKGSNDDCLSYIEKLKDLCKLKNVVVTVSIEEVNMLRKYNFNLDGKNVSMIASPNPDEVYYTYLRIYLRQYRKTINSEEFKELRDISDAVASGEKSLNESIKVFRNVMQKTDNRISRNDFEETLDKIIEEKVTLDDVVLDERIKLKISGQIDEFLKADGQKTLSLTKGLILTGPSGTGKTFLVKALANDKNCHFLNPSLSDLKGEYVGQTSPKVKRLFQKARACEPAIIFIDEADTVFPSRDFDGSSGDSDSFAKDMVNQFLVEMDGLTTGNSKVFVIAATNRVNVLDSAIKSRLGTPVEIPLPDAVNRERLFDKNLIKKGMVGFRDFSFKTDFIAKTNRLSGRDIKDFVDKLEQNAMLKGRLISSYKKEDEIKELFDTTLNIFENDRVKRLQDKLNIRILDSASCRQSYDTIIGYETEKKAIDNQVRMFDRKEREKAEYYKIKPKKGILLYGPPGNGKSKLAEAAAKKNNLYFMKITSDVFTKISPSEQNKTLIEIFDGALQLSEMCTKEKGVLLFFDEFDSLASSERLDSRIRGTMLTQLDDEKTLRNPETKVLFVGATNFYEKLDEAMIREGRIDEKFEMSNPARYDGIRMMKMFCEQQEHLSFSSEDIEYAYEKLVRETQKGKQHSFRMQYIEQFIINSFDDSDIEDKLKRIFEVNSQRYMPSGADIKGYFDKLVRSAYEADSYDYNNNCGERERLLITRDLIDDTRVG
ncbi:MAG: AAA family ATPase [Ruminococcus flavefaciens]|nr:AAA family ATPase [Ruminococcus flavefaciens]